MVKDNKGKVLWKKCHMTIDIDSLLIMEWLITKGNLY